MELIDKVKRKKKTKTDKSKVPKRERERKVERTVQGVRKLDVRAMLNFSHWYSKEF